MPYDPRVYELAGVFLADETEELKTPEKQDLLAQTIQDAIEDWLFGEREEPGE